MSIFGFILGMLPQLINLAEGIFSFKSKSGEQKKEFVSGTLKTAVDIVDSVSTGGQKKTWDTIAPAVSVMIDSAVEVANAAGVFSSGIDDRINSITAGGNS